MSQTLSLPDHAETKKRAIRQLRKLSTRIAEVYSDTSHRYVLSEKEGADLNRFLSKTCIMLEVFSSKLSRFELYQTGDFSIPDGGIPLWAARKV